MNVKKWRVFVKRIMDVIVAVILLLLGCLLFLVIALAIKLESPGPIIFKQKRIGKDGKPFTLFKFRSMGHRADDRSHQQHMCSLIKGDGSDSKMRAGKLPDDPRITRVGRVIRKTSLDELPQLYNILKGEMSLVGPRPSLPYEVELYTDWDRKRLATLPGITSPWALAGRADVPFSDQVRLDIEYIESQSLWLDIKILAQTPLVVLSGRGAG